MKLLRFLCLFLFLLFLFAGCASTKTYKEQYTGINTMLKAGDYEAAIAQLEAAKGEFYTEKERVIYYLDLGMLYHYNKQYKKSNELLTKAEYAIEELFTKSVSQAAASLLLNDNTMEYSGEDYEDIYLNIFKALNYLDLGDFDAAFVEIRRVNIKLNLLEDKYGDLAAQYSKSEKAKTDFEVGENKFHNSALARYLSMLLYRTEGKIDDARIDKEKIKEAWKLQAHLYNFPKPEIDEYLKDTAEAKLDLMVFTGRAPDKKANTLYIHTEKDLLIISTSAENPVGKQDLETLNIIAWPGIKKGYHFKFQLPYLEKQDSSVDRVELWIDGEKITKLRTIESIENVAIQTFEVKKPLIYLKTIVRTVSKGLLSASAKREMDDSIKNPLLGFATRLGTDLAVDATENADLRISHFFPKLALAGEIHLEPGCYNITIKYIGKNNTVIYQDTKEEFQIRKNDLNLVESFYLN